MRAIQYESCGGPDVPELVEAAEPHAAAKQVRVAVKAVGVNPVDWKFRQGMMGGDLPRRTGIEVAGVVDEVGEGVDDVKPGDDVFGSVVGGDGAADFALLENYAPMPESLDFAGAAALPVAVETATRTLDLLDVGAGQTGLVNGAAGAVGIATVQLARERGAKVIGTASAANHDYLRSFGAEATTYGDGLLERVRELAPDGVDRAIDGAGGRPAAAARRACRRRRARRDDRRLPRLAGDGRADDRRSRLEARLVRARRGRRADRCRTLLASRRADVPARADRRRAPPQRRRPRARQARAARRLTPLH